jgi:hypothetical protein
LKTFHKHGIAKLAIQNTDNPPSEWLWKENIVGQYVIIRVGGNFTFPPQPPAPDLSSIDVIQFIAGGVGIKYPRFDVVTNLQSTDKYASIHV